jgi:beta-ureidopropionase / N-carbamoyl-L-amino-acid hydrolase
MIEIKPERLLATLEALRNIGRCGTGVHRPALTPADLEARLWLRARLAELGFDARLDRFGTVLGRTPGDAPAILIGSHTDTVPQGGWLDGALGVAYALEIATARAEALGTTAARVDVVSFQDEEGTFVPLLGSRAFIGEITEPELFAEVQALDGRRLGEALAVEPIRAQPILRLDTSRTLAFLEGHIEQGPRLEAQNLPVGIVTAIVGIRRFHFAIEGRADHAGTTPMGLRRDAGAAALRLAVAILDRLNAGRGSDTVWNIGHVTLRPGTPNVVPAAAEFIVEVRDVEEKLLDTLEAAIRERAAADAFATGLPITVERTAAIPATMMTARLANAFALSAAAMGAGSMRLSSGAGHDAMMLARRVPTGMLFVPSIGGRSHHVSEDTRTEDIITGAQIMAGAVDLLLAA